MAVLALCCPSLPCPGGLGCPAQRPWDVGCSQALSQCQRAPGVVQPGVTQECTQAARSPRWRSCALCIDSFPPTPAL